MVESQKGKEDGRLDENLHDIVQLELLCCDGVEFANYEILG